jgi:hypothetical protein
MKQLFDVYMEVFVNFMSNVDGVRGVLRKGLIFEDSR